MTTLQEVINNKIELSSADIDALVNLLTSRCRHNTKQRVRSVLTYDLHTLNGWYLERIYRRNGDWCYCAGQDYPSELTIIRKLIIGN